MFRFRFDMNCNRIRASLYETRRVMIWMFDHEMNVERKFRMFAHRRDHGGAERNIVNEMSIHDVEVNPIGASRFDASCFLSEM